MAHQSIERDPKIIEMKGSVEKDVVTAIITSSDVQSSLSQLGFRRRIKPYRKSYFSDYFLKFPNDGTH